MCCFIILQFTLVFSFSSGQRTELILGKRFIICTEKMVKGGSDVMAVVVANGGWWLWTRWVKYIKCLVGNYLAKRTKTVLGIDAGLIN